MQEVYILSSRPADPDRARQIAALSDWSQVTGADALVGAEVDEALAVLHALGKQVAACVSVWEGCRRTMAETNARLGTTDIAPESVDAVQDKLVARQRLVRNGLSRVRVEILDAETLAAARRSGRACFVKPRRGVASFGSCRLTLERLAEVRREAAADADYTELLSRSPDFILEDCVDGPEYSFELVTLAGEALLVGVHEKTIEEGELVEDVDLARLKVEYHFDALWSIRLISQLNTYRESLESSALLAYRLSLSLVAAKGPPKMSQIDLSLASIRLAHEAIRSLVGAYACGERSPPARCVEPAMRATRAREPHAERNEAGRGRTIERVRTGWVPGSFADRPIIAPRQLACWMLHDPSWTSSPGSLSGSSPACWHRCWSAPAAASSSISSSVWSAPSSAAGCSPPPAGTCRSPGSPGPSSSRSSAR